MIVFLFVVFTCQELLLLTGNEMIILHSVPHFLCDLFSSASLLSSLSCVYERGRDCSSCMVV